MSTVTIPREQLVLPEGGAVRRVPVVAGVVGAVALLAAFAMGRGEAAAQLYHSYLVAFLFFASLCLGALFFILTQFLTRAGWGVVVRRLAEHVAAAAPLLFVLFVPVALGLHELYHWSHAEAVARDPLLAGKKPFLNVGGFYLRSIAYLAIWSGLGWWYRRQSQRQDADGRPSITRGLQSLSAPGTLIFAITLTLASFDWVMSLDAHWYSTVFGVYFFSGAAMAIFALLILMSIALQSTGVLTDVINAEHYHDLGKLLLGFVVFWAYIAFSQFMLIWYANIPEETIWFAHRWHGGWKAFSIFLAAGHFGLPFLVLLSRGVKRHKLAIGITATWLLFMHYVDIFWLVMPSLHADLTFHLLDLVTMIGVGGLFVATVAWLMGHHPLVPVNDPRLAESVAFENA